METLRPPTGDAPPDQTRGRRSDKSQYRRSIQHNGDVDGELIASREKRTRALGWIDQGEALGWRVQPFTRGSLLGDDRFAGKRPDQALGDHRIGCLIRRTDRGEVGFRVPFHRRLIDRKDGRSRAPDEFGKLIYQACTAQSGKIAIGSHAGVIPELGPRIVGASDDAGALRYINGDDA
jgi:hypothetical protein